MFFAELHTCDSSFPPMPPESESPLQLHSVSEQFRVRNRSLESRKNLQSSNRARRRSLPDANARQAQSAPEPNSKDSQNTRGLYFQKSRDSDFLRSAQANSP